jgi:hypothetical protein
MENFQSDMQLIHMLLARLERISADSYWAHRASGVRGALLGMLEKIENGRSVPRSRMKRLVDAGFSILESATVEKFK